MMLRTQETLDGEIIVDSFAGGGGASTGIELALGRIVNAAINHDPAAIRMHEANHPYTEHYQASVWDVDPETVCRERPVALAWFSPDCKHFSKAKGAALVDRKIRGLAWIVLRWAAKVRPRVIILENVEEFQTWGPVRKGKPVKKLAGTTFQKFIGQLRALGYSVEWRELVAADYGAPTTRRRLVLIARCDGRAIVWQERTHARETVRKCAAENCCHGAAPRRSSTGRCRALRFFRRRMKSTSGTAFPPSGRWRTTPCAALFAAWTSSRSNPGRRSSLSATIQEMGTLRIAKSHVKRLRQSTPVAFAGRSSRR